MKVIIGTRGSDLALWQAHHVKDKLAEQQIESQIKIIKTKGDQIQHLSFDKIEGKGFFTKEIEQALLDQNIDLAVHSYKDLETTQPKGLCIGATLERAHVADVLIVHPSAIDRTQMFGLKQNAKVGTSSARRKSQMLFFRPDVQIEDLRGNVPTRIEKCKESKYDAIILAKAGVDRLEIDLSDFHLHTFDARNFVSAASQGALALQCRSNDNKLIEVLERINHVKDALSVNLERSVLKSFNAGCQVPLGIYAQPNQDHFNLWVSKAKEADSTPIQVFLSGKDTQEMANQALEKTLNPIKKTLLWPKEESSEAPHFKMLKTAGITIKTQEFIQTKVLKSTIDLSNFQWVFFSSKKGVDAFFENTSIESISKLKIGAIALDTANYLQTKGCTVDFIGKENSTQASAEKFANTVSKQERVFFPISNISIKTAQRNLSPDQYQEQVIYQTFLTNQTIDISGVDAICFLSPSAVESFYDQHKTTPNHITLFSIGEKTTHALREKGVEHITTSYAPNSMALARTILGAI